MHRVRLALRAITVTWLLAQGIAMTTLAPMAMWSAANEDNGVECACEHGANAICPMHHKPASGARICLIGSIDSGWAALQTLFNLAGPIPAATQIAAATSIYVVSAQSTGWTLPRAVAPDPPPPRA